MRLWDEIKNLGKGLGEEVSSLGGEIKKIGNETVAEIKQDPAKYIAESAMKVAGSAVKLGKFVYEDATPEFVYQTMKQEEKLYMEGKLSPEQKEKHLQNRRAGVIHMQRVLRSLSENIIPEEATKKDLFSHINKIERSCRRLMWFLRLENLDLDKDVLDEANAVYCIGKEVVHVLEERCRNIDQE